MSLALAVTLVSITAWAADTKLANRPTKLISASCDINEQETSPTGLSVCHYLCKDPDKTKVSVVYSSSGSSQCRTPIERTLKVVIK